MPKQKKEAQSPQRIADLDTLRHFWDTMARYFPELLVNLCLFNYKVEGDKRPLARHDVRKDVPVGEVYDIIVKELLTDYYNGEDIIWKPSPSLTKTSMLWVDDFRFDNELELKPLFYIQTSPSDPDNNKPAKYQAFFKLTKPVSFKEADEFQKTLARLVGDKSATSYVHPRRMAGLANGKYEDDPLVIMFLGEEGDGILSPNELKLIAQYNLSPMAGRRAGVSETETQETNGQRDTRETQGQGDKQRQDKPKTRPTGRYIKPVVPVNYQPVLIKERKEFIKRRPDGTIDDSATDMAWATHIARFTYEAGWDDGAIVLTIYEELGNHSPELNKRKKTPKHAREYLYATAWKALMNVKNDKPKDKTKEETDPRTDFRR
jgi:hypothetical protein